MCHDNKSDNNYQPYSNISHQNCISRMCERWCVCINTSNKLTVREHKTLKNKFHFNQKIDNGQN